MTAPARFGVLPTPENKQLAAQEKRMDWMRRAACLTGFALVGIASSQGQLADKKALTLQIAKKVAAAAEQAAAANHNNMFVLIVDDGGNLMYMERMDDAQLGSFEVAREKARSAVFFKRPTKMFEEAVTKNGYTPILKRYTAGRWESSASRRGCISRHRAGALMAKLARYAPVWMTISSRAG
jgi:hypothetical protein